MTQTRDEEVGERLAAWAKAVDMVNPIIEKHGLDDQKIGANLFASTGTLTKVDQHIGHILTVSDWILKGELDG